MFDFFKKKTESNSVQNNNEADLSQSAPNETEKKDDGKKNFFSLTFETLKKTIEKTSESLVGNVVNKIEQEEEFDEFVLDDMEELLIKADLGVNTSSEIVDKLRKQNQILKYHMEQL